MSPAHARQRVAGRRRRRVSTPLSVAIQSTAAGCAACGRCCSSTRPPRALLHRLAGGRALISIAPSSEIVVVTMPLRRRTGTARFLLGGTCDRLASIDRQSRGHLRRPCACEREFSRRSSCSCRGSRLTVDPRRALGTRHSRRWSVARNEPCSLSPRCSARTVGAAAAVGGDAMAQGGAPATPTEPRESLRLFSAAGSAGARQLARLPASTEALGATTSDA